MIKMTSILYTDDDFPSHPLAHSPAVLHRSFAHEEDHQGDASEAPDSSRIEEQAAEPVVELQQASQDGTRSSGSSKAKAEAPSIADDKDTFSAVIDETVTTAGAEDELVSPDLVPDDDNLVGSVGIRMDSSAIADTTASFDHFVPIEYIVNTCIREEIALAYDVISSTCVRILREELRIVDIASILREVLLMHSGNFAQTLIESIFSLTKLNNGLVLSEAKVAFCVEGSLKSCFPNLEGDFAEAFVGKVMGTLHGCQCTHTHTHTHTHMIYIFFLKKKKQVRDRYKGSKVASFVNCNRIEALDFVMIGYNMSWPLDLVITKEALNLYSTIASFFLRAKRAATAISESWAKLREIDRSLEQTSRRPGASAQRIREARDRMKQLFIFRYPNNSKRLA